METFKYLNKEGDVYTLAGQVGFSKVAITIEIGLGAFCFARYFTVKADPFLIIFGLVFFVLAYLTFLRLNHKIIFNPTDRTVTFPKLRDKEGAVYSFDDFANFTMVKIKQYFVLTTNNWLQMEFEKDGKTKSFQIRQYGPSAKNAQALVEEIEKVMGIDSNYDVPANG